MDKDTFSRDDPLGEISIDLDDLKTTGLLIEYNQPLPTQGRLVFSVKWEASDAAAAAAAANAAAKLTAQPALVLPAAAPVPTALPLSPPPAAPPAPDAVSPPEAREPPSRSHRVAHKLLPYTDMPMCTNLLMWPLALAWAPIAGVLLMLAFTAFAIHDTPPTLAVAVEALVHSRRFGPIGKVLTGIICLVIAIAMVPIAALIGLGTGIVHGGLAGGRYMNGEGSADFVTAPVAWLREEVMSSLTESTPLARFTATRHSHARWMIDRRCSPMLAASLVVARRCSGLRARARARPEDARPRREAPNLICRPRRPPPRPCRRPPPCVRRRAARLAKAIGGGDE